MLKIINLLNWFSEPFLNLVIFDLWVNKIKKGINKLNIIKEKLGGLISKIGKTRIKIGKDILANIDPNDT